MNIKDDMKITLSNYRKFIKKESYQTKEMIIVFRDLLHKQLGGNKNPTQKDIEEAISQLKDVGKISALLPLILLPGSILTIPILIKLGKRYNINIMPNR